MRDIPEKSTLASFIRNWRGGRVLRVLAEPRDPGSVFSSHVLAHSYLQLQFYLQHHLASRNSCTMHLVHINSHRPTHIHINKQRLKTVVLHACRKSVIVVFQQCLMLIKDKIKEEIARFMPRIVVEFPFPPANTNQRSNFFCPYQ